MTADVDTTTERWVYAGRRILNGDQLADRWITDRDERPVHFKRRANAPSMPSVGSAYDVEVNRENGVTMVGRPEYAKDQAAAEVGEATRAEWALEDRAAWTRVEQMRLEAKARREGTDIGAMTLADVRHVVANAGPRRQAVLAQVLHYLYA